QDTTFEAVSLDTTLVGFPALGLDPSLTLISRGDTVDVRAVVRFDSLPSTFLKNSGDSTITALDSSYVIFIVRDTLTSVHGPVRIDAYDVDTTAADSSVAAIRALFRSDRLIGGATFDSVAVKDSIKVPLNNAAVLRKVFNKHRLRVGFRATSVTAGRPVTVDLGSIDGGESPFLRFDPAPADTSIKALTVSPISKTPSENTQLAADFADYAVVFAAPPPPATGTLSVGGLPARRSYLRFNIPAHILDSATVLRATLFLTQRPNRSVASHDTVAIIPQIVTAGVALTDLYRSSLLINSFAFDSLRVAPSDSGTRALELANALRQWNSKATLQPQRAIVIRSTREGVAPFELLFYSTEAASGLRPRLRVNYVRRSSFGIP
ncbi:MAG: hypothetical protein ABIT38_04840, partial [Gemmatimonadaceae bacterium]